MKRSLSAISVLAVFLAGSPGTAAEPTGFSANTFQVAPGHGSFLSIEGASVKHKLSLRLGMVYDYQYRPLLAKVCEQSNGGTCSNWGEEVPVIEHRLLGNFFTGIAFLKLLEVGVVLPVVLYQSGKTAAAPAGAEKISSPNNTAGLEDLRLHLKLDVLQGIFRYDGGKLDLNLALVPSMTFPVGNALASDSFMGDSSFTFHPRVAFSLAIGRLRMGFNLGYLVVEEKETSIAHIGSGLSYGAAAEIRIISKLTGIVELFGKHSLKEDIASSPLETALAMQYRFGPGFAVIGGIGARIIEGLGSPTVRGFAGLTWMPPLPGDTDGDGLKGLKDRCPSDAEDRDGFEDEDGCPDPDNDGDGIDDERDRCPEKPEDKDGHQDQDGCPDTDNDGDGVIDDYDTCPQAKEDADGYKDDDGCPDLDNDNDGIPDTEDACAAEREVFNGNKDKDGCSDQGPELVRFSGTQIELLAPVEFKGTTSAQLKSGTTRKVLDVVTTLLKLHPKMQLRIEAHSDAKRTRKRNLRKTFQQAAAVLRYLIKKDVSPDRLEAVGLGPDRPPGTGAEPRWRIEFHIIDNTNP